MKLKFTVLLLFLVTVFLLKPDTVQPVLQRQQVESLADWSLFKEKLRYKLQDKIYGFMPKDIKPSFKVVKSASLSHSTGHYKEIEINFDGYQKTILLSLFLPNTESKYGVFLALNRCGAHTLLKDKVISISPHGAHHKFCLNKQSRGSDEKHYSVKEILRSGYAFATIDGAELAADGYQHKGIKKNNKTSDLWSLIQTHKNKSKSWGALAAWAYGYQLGAQYLVTDANIKSNQIIATGHSRRGKAALLATALDNSIAMVIPHQSGTGGTASLKSSIFKESPKKMVGKSWIYNVIGEQGTLAYFFSGSFKEKIKGEGVSSLGLDASDLMALVAPRPLLDTQGVKDFWAGGKSAWRMMKEANSVYRLYGVQGLKKRRWFGGKYAGINSKTTGRLHQHYLKTGHGLNKEYWMLSVDFANLHFGQ